MLLLVQKALLGVQLLSLCGIALLMYKKCSLTLSKHILRVSKPVLKRGLPLRLMHIFINQAWIKRLISRVRLQMSELGMLKSITQQYVALWWHYMMIIISMHCGFAASITLVHVNLANLHFDFLFIRPLIFVTTQKVNNSSSTSSHSSLSFVFHFFILRSCPCLYITIMLSNFSRCSLYLLINNWFIVLSTDNGLFSFIIFFIVYQEIIRRFLLGRREQ